MARAYNIEIREPEDDAIAGEERLQIWMTYVGEHHDWFIDVVKHNRSSTKEMVYQVEMDGRLFIEDVPALIDALRAAQQQVNRWIGAEVRR